MNTKNFVGLFGAGATLVSVMFAANPAQSAIFNVGGTDYDITTITGNYYSLKTQLEATPWWEGKMLVGEFAIALGSAMSGTNGLGPVFALYTWPTAVVVSVSYLQTDGRVAYGYVYDSVNFDYATITPSAVPEPLTVLGAITAVGFGVAFKCKQNSKKEE